MDYYLRYATYALVAGSMDVLDERVLQGLRETYNSLGVPIGPTVQGIQIMKEIVKEQGSWELKIPHFWMSRLTTTRELSEQDI